MNHISQTVDIIIETRDTSISFPHSQRVSFRLYTSVLWGQKIINNIYHAKPATIAATRPAQTFSITTFLCLMASKTIHPPNIVIAKITA